MPLSCYVPSQIIPKSRVVRLADKQILKRHILSYPKIIVSKNKTGGWGGGFDTWPMDYGRKTPIYYYSYLWRVPRDALKTCQVMVFVLLSVFFFFFFFFFWGGGGVKVKTCSSWPTENVAMWTNRTTAYVSKPIVTSHWLCCRQVHILLDFMKYAGLQRLLQHQIHQHTPNTQIWLSVALRPQKP